ncbi:MAG: cryptochrome/photolyase family protein, partial [Cyanobacteriota bacterium]
MELIWILADQLLPEHPLLRAPDPNRWVAMIESAPRARRLRYHQQKLTLLYSAMRNNAEDLERAGHRVLYHRLEAPLFKSDAATEITAPAVRDGAGARAGTPTSALADSEAVLA